MANKGSLFNVLNQIVRDRNSTKRAHVNANKAYNFRTINDDSDALFAAERDALNSRMNADRNFRANFAPAFDDDESFNTLVERVVTDPHFARSMNIPKSKRNYWGVSDVIANKDKAITPEELVDEFNRSPYGTGGLYSASPAVKKYAEENVYGPFKK